MEKEYPYNNPKGEGIPIQLQEVKEYPYDNFRKRRNTHTTTSGREVVPIQQLQEEKEYPYNNFRKRRTTHKTSAREGMPIQLQEEKEYPYNLRKRRNTHTT